MTGAGCLASESSHGFNGQLYFPWQSALRKRTREEIEMSRPYSSAALVISVALVVVVCMLQPATSYADEADDIARVLELNDAYAEATRAWRAKEISRSEMQARQKAIQAEGRSINSSYGAIGTPERRAWDQKVLQAKNAHTKQKRQDAQAAQAEAAAQEREAREAERAAAAAAAAEKQAIAEREAAARAAAERAEALKSPLVPVDLVIDFEPANQLELDALALAPLEKEIRALEAEQNQLNRLPRTSAGEARLSLISERLDILVDRKRGVTSAYSDASEEADDLSSLARALGGDFEGIKPEDATHMPDELHAMVAENAARVEASLEVGRRQARQYQRQQWINLVIGSGGGKLALWVAIILGIAMGFGVPRGIARLSQDGKTLTLSGRKFALSTLSGTLLDSQQRTEESTLIEASGGTGTIVGGHGYITPRQEAVKDITTFDTLFVRDDTGVEHEVELEDFGLRARIGNRLTVMLANGPRAGGRPILVHNDDTRKYFYSTRVMRELFKPSFIWALVNAALIFVIAKELALPLLDDGDVFGSVLVSSFCIYWIGGNRLTVAAIRAGRFNSSKASRQLVRLVAGE